MTPVEKLVRGMIEARGPISTADYMALCLSHPEHGYYITRDPLGQAGDFTTAPEISQMFGEMIGIWLAAMAAEQGLEAPVIAELGPGRGTLMADALRSMAALGRAPGEVWMVETSPVLRRKQAEAVPAARHADSIDALPDRPCLIVANEFFDALPVHQYLETETGWRERQVGLADGGLIWGLSGKVPVDPPVSDWWEQSFQADAIAARVGERITRHGGAALVFDYGYRRAARPAGPSFQAILDKRKDDPLTRPGEADLTWLIDFDHLAEIWDGLSVSHATQGGFLARMGIGQRAGALARANPAGAETVAEALHRLTAPEQMGNLFRVIAALPAGSPTPPGF